MEASGHVGSDVALLLQLKILGLVQQVKGVGRYLILAAEIVLLDNAVGAQVVFGLAVADENWLSGTHGLTLFFKAFVGVATVDNPLGVVGVDGVKGSLLQSGNGREDVHALGSAAEDQGLLVAVLICLDFDFLTETNNRIAAENVSSFDLHHRENVAVHWAAVNLAGVQTVGLINVVLFNTEVDNEITSSLLIAEHNAVTGAEETVLAVGPGHLLIAVLNL